MATQPLSVLYDEIRPHALKASLPAIDIAIRRAARYFCANSTVWRDSISVDVVAGLPEYSLVDTNSDAEVLDIEAAQFNVSSAMQIPMVATSPERLGEQSFAPYPCVFFLDPPSRIVIGPTSAITQNIPAGLWVRCILQPTLTATTLDSGLLQRANQAIVNGALAWLLSQKNTPWTDLMLSADFKRMFEANIKHLKTQVELGFQRTEVLSDVHRW